MSAHIEWLNTQDLNITGTAIPGLLHNDGAENEVAAVRLVNGDPNWGGGNGVIIQGPPAEILKRAKELVSVAEVLVTYTEAHPELRSLYGLV